MINTGTVLKMSIKLLRKKKVTENGKRKRKLLEQLKIHKADVLN